MTFAETTKAHRGISNQVPEFLHLLSLLPTRFPVSILSGKSLPLNVQSLLLDAGTILLNSTLLLYNCRLSTQSRRLVLLLLNLSVPLVDGS